MSIKQIVNRLRDISRDAWSQDHNRMPQMGRELDGVITDLRALDGKTVLPVEVVEYLTKTPYNKIVLTWHHGSFWAQTLLGPSAADELTCRPEPAAALDALAEEIRRTK